jgi:hypothetical protein
MLRTVSFTSYLQHSPLADKLQLRVVFGPQYGWKLIVWKFIIGFYVEFP